MPRLWIDTGLNNDVTIGTQFLVSLMSGVSATQTRFDRMTLLRTIVRIDAARTVHDSGEGSERLAIGIAVASQEAFAAGAVSDPGVDTDFPTRGWVWRAQYRIYGFAADQPVVYNLSIDKDLRAQRKLENGEAFLAADLFATEGVNSTTRLIGVVRQLWLVG